MFLFKLKGGILISNLLNVPAIVAALITGLVALLTFIIKYRYDTKVNFEKILKDKLELIYSPLIIEFSKVGGAGPLVSDKAIECIRKYGHLLSKELLDDLRELYKIEQGESFLDDCKLEIEHNNLKNKLIEKINLDFYKLQDSYNQYYSQYEKRFNTPPYKKALTALMVACVAITICFYLILIIKGVKDYLLSIIKAQNNVITNDPWMNFFYIVLALVIILTSLFLFGYIGGYCVAKILNHVSRYKKYYDSYEFVKDSGVYRCRICGKSITLTKYSKLKSCIDYFNCKHTVLQKIKGISKWYTWAYESGDECRLEAHTLKDETVEKPVHKSKQKTRVSGKSEQSNAL
ncbi:MAG: hypothetical protein N3B21_18175 [Clostridia bacterium]|nr:hypothetical protein [Clostridia bacterium]